jgi:NhaP-type Na+/H+ or K+/H+ antiporter
VDEDRPHDHGVDQHADHRQPDLVERAQRYENELVLVLVVGVGLGQLGGWLTRVVLAALEAPSVGTTVTIAASFAAYLAAKHLRGSGVLAVLALGLYLRTTGRGAISARGWLDGRSVWQYADLLITRLVFVLVGFEATRVLEHSSTGTGDAAPRRAGARCRRGLPAGLDGPGGGDREAGSEPPLLGVALWVT